jgi:hypothetical protein
MNSVVIPLGSGSTHNNRELIYALRGIDKYLHGVANVVIVGDLPSFVQNVIHIHFAEMSHKQANIRRKILVACDDERVTDDFCFMNDDVFILQPMDIPAIPYWYMGDLSTMREKGTKPLIEELTKQNLPTKRFDLHQPINYNKDKFREAVSHFSDQCIIKSTYCNYHRIEGEETMDLKITNPFPIRKFKEFIEGRSWFSVGDNGLQGGNMWKLLDELYPEKSRYEV